MLIGRAIIVLQQNVSGVAEESVLDTCTKKKVHYVENECLHVRVGRLFGRLARYMDLFLVLSSTRQQYKNFLKRYTHLPSDTAQTCSNPEDQLLTLFIVSFRMD